ncbi:L-rhamnose isomerase [Parabacteroides provencensis]|uniref:L-rhamnose isomerase n=1 Tax=Parabacteroides provencensis TaxID=1944636 RepID=UPI000C15CC78|nr:L-rhamnose isomerase [Parabacteroides provencensis]
MIKESLIHQAFEMAAERYAAVGVDVHKALNDMRKISLSLHCWQADDVSGFENQGNSLSGGIQVTGNYPGRARTIDQLRADILKAKSYIPGRHRLNLHEIYGDFQGKKVDRDAVEPKHFESWMQWAKVNDFKLDFNSTSFSHPKSGDLTLANPNDEIRNFWIEHTKRCRLISEEMGKYQNDPCMMNLWIHDGSKEVPASRLRYRRILEQSLDDIYSVDYKNMKDCIEAKLFGIGLENYTVGSYDFYLGYGVKKNKIVTLDTGHFHLTESIADKVSSLLLFTPEIMLHVSRPVRWDSDHVVTLTDDLLDLAREIIRCNALDRVHIGLDYFDATINRIGAYVIGSRATQKAFMQALLEPIRLLCQYEDEGKYFERLALQEEAKSLPWGAVWDMFCLQNDVLVGESYINEVERYEKEVTGKR